MRSVVSAAVVALPMLGVLAIGVATRWGVGLSPDSASYIGGASGLLSGQGFAVSGVAITHFPPLYSALIASVSAVGLRPLEAARWLNALLFGANALLVVSLVRRGDPSATAAWLGPAAGLLFLASPTMLAVHSMAWSEPTFFFFWLLGVLALAAYHRTSRRTLLVASAACSALTLLTRYAAVPVVMTAVIVLLCSVRHTAWRRIIDVTVYLAVSLAPFAFWLVRNASVGGNVTNRTISWQPIDAARVAEAVQVATSWLFIPTRVLPGAVAGTLLLLVVGVAVAVVVRDAWDSVAGARRREGMALAPTLGIFSALYIGFLCISIALVDPSTPLDRRILSPVFVASLIVLVHGMQRSARWRSPLARWAVVLLLCGLVVRSIVGGLLFVRSSSVTGLGLNSKAWQESEVMQAVARLPSNVLVYSNRPHAVFLHTGRLTSDLAQLQQGRDPNPYLDPGCDSHIARFLGGVPRDAAVLVCFGHRPIPAASLHRAENLSAPQLTVLLSGADGVIYGVRESAREAARRDGAIPESRPRDDDGLTTDR